MNYFQAIILSIVEGVTEFLPISSTGHLILTSNLLGIPQSEFMKSFEIFIQLGAILAVIVLYWRTLIKNITLCKPVFVAFLPTAILGFTLYKFIKQYLLGNTLITLTSLFIGGILLIILEKKYTKIRHEPQPIEKLSTKKALLIGLFQSISMIPGVSRAAATIFGGLFLGLTRSQAVEFSFLLAIPTMLAATALDLLKSNLNFSGNEYLLLSIGFIGAFITAIISIKFLLNFIKNHTFIPFGIYRIILAVLFLVMIIR